MLDKEKDFYNEIYYTIRNLSSYPVRAIDGELPEYERTEDKKYLSHIEQLKNLNKEQKEALKKVLQHACVGVVHSLFVSVDGGTALSDNGKALDVVDFETQKSLTTGALHENFIFNLPADLA